MKATARGMRGTRSSRLIHVVAGALLASGLAACHSGPPQIPNPRPIVIRSGARLYPEKDRLQKIDEWFRTEMNAISTDPGFWIIVENSDSVTYPWQSLFMHGDTAQVSVDSRISPDATSVYQIYAHLHLMKVLGRLDEFLPGYADADPFQLEREILSKVSDAWLLGRAVYDASPYQPLEEIMYANENGYLDAFILTARPDAFSQERQTWLQENPQALEQYRGWFVETFSRQPPGMRGGP